MSPIRRVFESSRDLKLFLVASFGIGMAGSIIDATLNNFLNYRFVLTGFQRSFLELPRELPGLLVVVVSAMLAFLCSRRLGALSMVFCLLGAVLMGAFSKTYRLIMVWLFMYSLGQHLFIPVASTIGMELAANRKVGRRLGQLNSIRNFSAVIGIFFQPLLGWSIDRFGERVVLASEALLLIVVCAGYGFARTLFAPQIAFLIACGCFLLDQMLMSVNMARSTYMKKIATDPSHVQPSLTLATSIDHIFSISIALLAGIAWSVFGYTYVFLIGAVIAAGNLFAALRIRLPEPLSRCTVQSLSPAMERMSK
jgi:MFS family permease